MAANAKFIVQEYRGSPHPTRSFLTIPGTPQLPRPASSGVPAPGTAGPEDAMDDGTFREADASTKGAAQQGIRKTGSVHTLAADSSNHGGQYFFHPPPPNDKEPPQQVAIQVETDETKKSCDWLTVHYFRKMRGGADTALPIPHWFELLASWVGAFLGILAVSGLNQVLSPTIKLTVLVPSFGASAVLIFGVIESKLAQPRNFIGGQILSAIVGVIVRLVLKDVVWLSAAVGMSLALFVMQLTKTTHPPGGATALIAASAKEIGKWAGFQFVISVAVGSFAMLVVALLVNNLVPHRRYPTFWW